MTSECACCCNSSCRTTARDANGVRQPPRYDQRIPCGSNRSTVQRTHFAKVSEETSGGLEAHGKAGGRAQHTWSRSAQLRHRCCLRVSWWHADGADHRSEGDSSKPTGAFPDCRCSGSDALRIEEGDADATNEIGKCRSKLRATRACAEHEQRKLGGQDQTGRALNGCRRWDRKVRGMSGHQRDIARFLRGNVFGQFEMHRAGTLFGSNAKGVSDEGRNTRCAHDLL